MKQETIARIRRFSKERDWEQFHTPVNLAKSISIEAGELLECFQWSDTDYDLKHAGEELADVMKYCQNMLDALGMDADSIINTKMDQNEAKYPVQYQNEQFQMRLKTYTDFTAQIIQHVIDHCNGVLI